MRALSIVLAVTTALMLAVAAPFAQDKPAEFGLAVYKPGEKYATDEQAGEAIDKLAGHLSGDKATFKRRGVRNSPTEALKLFKDDKQPVAVGIVSPAFYFTNKDALKLTALAEARRGNADGARYTLVGATKPEKYPEGKRIATSLTIEKEWLNRVVMPAPENAKPIQWVQYDNLFDAAYEIIDGEDDAPDFVLADSISLQAMQKDVDLKVLKLGLQSELLPQDLVVEVDSRLGAAREALLKALTDLDKTDAGKKVGELIQSPTFQKPDAARLEKAGKLWAEK
ncbi:MAG: hypothetical protein IT464_14525 [Planctomycetes bacterium]|nr:hypothetical protein [Planctomycetota bacterium]